MIPNAQFLEFVEHSFDYDDDESDCEGRGDDDKNMALSSDIGSCNSKTICICRDYIWSVICNIQRRAFLLMHHDHILSCMIQIGCDPTCLNIKLLNIDNLRVFRLLVIHMNILMQNIGLLFKNIKTYASVKTGARFGILRADESIVRQTQGCQKCTYHIGVHRIRECLKKILVALYDLFSIEFDERSESLNNDSNDFAMVSIVELLSIKKDSVFMFSTYLNSIASNNDSTSQLNMSYKLQSLIHLSGCAQQLLVFAVKQRRTPTQCSKCNSMLTSINFEFESVSQMYFIDSWNKNRISEFRSRLNSLLVKFHMFETHVYNHEAVANSDADANICKMPDLKNSQVDTSVNKVVKVEDALSETGSEQTNIYTGEGTITSSYVPLAFDNNYISLEASQKHLTLMIPELKERLVNMGKANKTSNYRQQTTLHAQDDTCTNQSSLTNESNIEKDSHNLSENHIASQLENLIVRKLGL